MDFFSEILNDLRQVDFTPIIRNFVKLNNVTIRDEIGIFLLEEGLTKMLFSDKKFSKLDLKMIMDILLKYFGIAINIHRDIKIHSNVIYDKQTLFLISRIYNFLNKLYYGNCFLLPRQIKDFENYLRYNKKKWNLI